MSRKAKHDIAPLIRGGFRRGLQKYMRKHGKTMSDVFMDWIETDGIGAVIKTIAPYNVREARLEGAVKHDHAHTVDVTISQVNEFIAGLTEDTGQLEDSDTTTALPH